MIAANFLAHLGDRILFLASSIYLRNFAGEGKCSCIVCQTEQARLQACHKWNRQPPGHVGSSAWGKASCCLAQWVSVPLNPKFISVFVMSISSLPVPWKELTLHACLHIYVIMHVSSPSFYLNSLSFLPTNAIFCCRVSLAARWKRPVTSAISLWTRMQ